MYYSMTEEYMSKKVLKPSSWVFFLFPYSKIMILGSFTIFKKLWDLKKSTIFEDLYYVEEFKKMARSKGISNVLAKFVENWRTATNSR